MVTPQLDGFDRALLIEAALLSSADVCRLLGISKISLWRVMRGDPSFPKALRFQATSQRSRLKFRTCEISAWIKAQQIATAAAENGNGQRGIHGARAGAATE
jgi:predicted DNA-binding transcriptional regulator AlpA